MKFSLITVTMGDRPHLLAKLKASLDAQTYRDFELIVVNHEEHPKFKGGLSRARNFGIERASGDVLGFLDDDAWYGPDLLESVSVMLADPENDGVSFRVVDDYGNCSAGGWMPAGKTSVSKGCCTAMGMGWFYGGIIIHSPDCSGLLGCRRQERCNRLRN